MPTYDYACSGCNHRFELFQSMTAPIKRTCPKCRKRTLERLIGPGAGFLFKGDGFYITDYRSDRYKKDSKAEAAPKSGDGGGGSKGDTAPATKDSGQPRDKKSAADKSGKKAD